MTTEAVTASPEAVEPKPLENLSPTQYSEWRKTGQIPDEEPTPKKEAAAKESPAAPAKKAAEKTPAGESIHRLGYQELRNRVRELESENERLKIPREEVRTREPEPEKKEAAAETVRPKPQATDKDKDGKPKYQTYEDFVEDLSDWKAEQRLAAYEKSQAEKAAKDAVQREQQKVTQTWTEQVESARSKHADFDKVALDPEMTIPQGSAVEQWVLNSEIGTELLYYLGQHRDELAAVHKMHPVAAARFLTALEAELSGDEPEPEKKPPATETKTTKAPPPTREVGGRGTAAVDEINKAVADDDVRAYINSKNRQDIARKKR